MAIKNIPVPFCDECGEPWLPKFKQPDGTHNPIFDHPEQSKRCGKCKTTRWNAAGVDKRRKNVESPAPEVVNPEPKGFQAGRCKHLLFNCPQCHPKEAA